MSGKVVFKITDYFEPDLNWEEEECHKLGIDFHYYQMKAASPQQLIDMLKDADIILTDTVTFNAEVIDRLERLKLLIRHGVGYDKIDVAAATQKGIIVANEPTASSDDVAEHTLMLMLETLRKRKLQDKLLLRWIEAREWDSAIISSTYRLKGKTVGIIGCGNIGSRVLTKLSGLGVKVLVCDPYLAQERYDELGISHVPFDDVLKIADIVTIHVPLTDQTRGMFHLDKFKLMKDSAIIINTARGPIINTADLVIALKQVIIAGAGLDVFDQEPPSPELELLKMDNVMLTPHIGWYSQESSQDIRYMIMDDVKKFMQGELPKFVVNPEVLTMPGLRFAYKNRY